jgi:Zn-dependent protease with chaperone function
MTYSPKLPEHNDNVSHTHPLREFFLILGGLVSLAGLAFWLLGMLVDVAVDRISPETEARISRAVAIKWMEEKPHSLEKQKLIQNLAERLASCTDLPYEVDVRLADSPQANAVALPGGQIVLFSGLLDKLQSENGLAFVLAHEFSHLKNRDHLRAMGRSLLLVTFSAVLTGSNSGLTQLFVPLNQLGMAQHSQAREMQADNAALQILNCHYGHVGGAGEFFEAMQKEERVEESGFSHYFATHPALQQRIATLQKFIRQHGYHEGPTQPLL